MAPRIGKLLGNRPDLWLSFQRDWDLHEARQRLAAELDGIETLVA